MLKQKCLKDIDWNRVACDPVLLEEISNGHAARMRFSRFRTTVENQRRSRQARLSGGSSSSAPAASTASMSTFRVSKPKSNPKRDTRNGRKRLTDADADDPAQDMDQSPRPLSPPDENRDCITQPKRGGRPGGLTRPLAPIKTENQPFGAAVQAASPLFGSEHSLARNFSSSSAPEMPSFQARIRDLTPCSDDQSSPETTDPTTSTHAFRFATAASAAAAAAAHYGNTAMTPPWMTASSLPPAHAQQPLLSCPPFSPPLGVYDLATLDTAGFAHNNFCPGSLAQQPPTTQEGMQLAGYAMGQPGMAVFPRHDGMWDTLLGQGNDLHHQGI